MNYRIVFNLAEFTNKKLNPRTEQAQKWLDNEVLKDCGPYVPFRYGHLFRSGITATKVGSGEVEYNAPYAKRVYYGSGMHFSKDKHPQACAQWFEKAKGVNKEKWLDGVKKIMHGGS